jgi:hypothetical protein
MPRVVNKLRVVEFLTLVFSVKHQLVNDVTFELCIVDQGAIVDVWEHNMLQVLDTESIHEVIHEKPEVLLVG